LTAESYAGVRAVIFDVDGVLLDARPSYHAVAEEAARRAVAEIAGEEKARAAPFDRVLEVAQFKAAGNFNDDWEMARAIALVLLIRARHGKDAPSLAYLLASAGGRGVEGLYAHHGHELADLTPRQREALSLKRIATTCGALYGGKSHCKLLFGFDPPPWAPDQGLWEREELLADAALLRQVAKRFPLALFTGRNPGEAELALIRTGLVVPEPRRWVSDGRPRKPEPHGLVELCRDLLPSGGQALFVGDTADDRKAAEAARALGARLLYAHVAEPGETSRVLEKLLREAPG
jgi:HAD superfamily hydrolase (TIGR01548 family)